MAADVVKEIGVGFCVLAGLLGWLVGIGMGSANVLAVDPTVNLVDAASLLTALAAFLLVPFWVDRWKSRQQAPVGAIAARLDRLEALVDETSRVFHAAASAEAVLEPSGVVFHRFREANNLLWLVTQLAEDSRRDDVVKRAKDVQAALREFKDVLTSGRFPFSAPALSRSTQLAESNARRRLVRSIDLLRLSCY